MVILGEGGMKKTGDVVDLVHGEKVKGERKAVEKVVEGKVEKEAGDMGKGVSVGLPKGYGLPTSYGLR